MLPHSFCDEMQCLLFIGRQSFMSEMDEALQVLLQVFRNLGWCRHWCQAVLRAEPTEGAQALIIVLLAELTTWWYCTFSGFGDCNYRMQFCLKQLLFPPLPFFSFFAGTCHFYICISIDNMCYRTHVAPGLGSCDPMGSVLSPAKQGKSSKLQPLLC